LSKFLGYKTWLFLPWRHFYSIQATICAKSNAGPVVVKHKTFDRILCIYFVKANEKKQKPNDAKNEEKTQKTKRPRQRPAATHQQQRAGRPETWNASTLGPPPNILGYRNGHRSTYTPIYTPNHRSSDPAIHLTTDRPDRSVQSSHTQILNTNAARGAFLAAAK